VRKQQQKQQDAGKPFYVTHGITCFNDVNIDNHYHPIRSGFIVTGGNRCVNNDFHYQGKAGPLDQIIHVLLADTLVV
jgi:hypothetical protein